MCNFKQKKFNVHLHLFKSCDLLRRVPYALIILTTALLLPLLFPRCANIIPPTGGPRDTIPPEVVSSEPPNYSTLFTGTEIMIEFDEFIQLRNINQQFIITPPQRERPEFRVRGRNLLIDLNTELVPNTTYTLNFGDAIVDLNEGNVLTNYEFVFSTGDVIDSLHYSGIVLNAYDNEPAEGVVVMLYDNLHDSVPFRQMPLYATRTAEDGRFRLNNLRADTFKVFALQDAGNNYLYDRPGEEAIAFLEEFIYPDTLHNDIATPVSEVNDTLNGPELFPEEDAEPDTLDIMPLRPEEPESDNGRTPAFTAHPGNDTVLLITDPDAADPHVTDTIPEIPPERDPGPRFGFRTGDTLYLFTELTGRQYIRRTERNRQGELLFVFNLPVTGKWSAEPVNFDPPGEWKLVDINSRKDSIRLWITDPATREIENMQFAFSYWADGPSDSLQVVTDTINMNYVQRTVSRRQAAEEEEAVLEVSFGIADNGNQHLHKNLPLSFPAPLAMIDESLVELVVKQNDEAIQRDYELVRDSLQIRKYRLVTDWMADQEYRLTTMPGAFEDIFGLQSDTLDLRFQTRGEDYYGSIILNITGVTGPMIIQLKDNRGTVLSEHFTGEDTTIRFDYLDPLEYRIKGIFDKNDNRKWDTGNYLEGIKPERVIFYPVNITTRAGWAIEEDWQLEDPGMP